MDRERLHTVSHGIPINSGSLAKITFKNDKKEYTVRHWVGAKPKINSLLAKLGQLASLW